MAVNCRLNTSAKPGVGWPPLTVPPRTTSVYRGTRAKAAHITGDGFRRNQR